LIFLIARLAIMLNFLSLAATGRLADLDRTDASIEPQPNLAFTALLHVAASLGHVAILWGYERLVKKRVADTARETKLGEPVLATSKSQYVN